MDTRREMMGGVLSSSKLIDNYLTIEALEDGLFASLSFNACEYCIDSDGNWRSLPMDTTTETINTGQTLSFRGEITPTSSGIGSFSVNKKFNLLGNCMSLLFGDNAANNFSLEGKGSAFVALFATCKVVEVNDNFLPATILSPYCYHEMFDSCDYLIKTPSLPATTLANYCYTYMFSSCASLTTAPELPATTLANSCYFGMFSSCVNLTTAPELPATTLTYQCYSYMFWNCDNLTEAPELPATTLERSCYECMFDHCVSLVDAPELPATTLVDNCYYSMFNGCNSLTTAPKLPATTLASGCYSSMFQNCTSLTTAPELPATTLAYDCYSYMFCGCNKLNYIKMLATDISATDCLTHWVNGVASSGTFVKNPAMITLPNAILYNDYAGAPSGWTVLNA